MGLPVLSIKSRNDRRLRAGHLWIFSNEVSTQKTPLKGFRPGDEVTVLDNRDKPLGSACINPATLICGRLHSFGPDVPLDRNLIGSRLASALALREKCFSEPYYRLCFSEGDFLPGLTIDRFGSHLTIQVTTAGMEARKPLIRDALTELVQPSSLLWDNNLPSRVLEGLPTENQTEGSVPEELEVPENGCVYLVPALTGQKTGWYYDQRLNRAAAAKCCPGADVLDCFSYVGGFGVAAARAGAKSVTFVDASEQALSYCRRNMERNAPACGCETIQGDAFDLLNSLYDKGRRFDVVSIDPPALIRREKDRKQGLMAYTRLNILASHLVREGGVLVSSSCSQHLDALELRSAISRAAARTQRVARIFYQGGQGPDHPANSAMLETSYLKCFMASFTK